MSTQTILVVDDAVVTLKVAATILRSSGYTVQLASTAEQALSTLRTLRPDLVLADLNLPGMSGLDLVRRIRNDSRLRDVKVVAMTAVSRPGIEQEAIDAGYHGFLAKPVDQRRLNACMTEHLMHQPEEDQGNGQRDELSLLAGLSLSGPELEGLRRGFLDEGTFRCRRLLAKLDSYFDPAAARSLAYQWIGRAGAFGYPAISSLALELEPLLGSLPLDKELIREVLTGLAFAFVDASEAANTALPEYMVQALTGKRVAVVGFSEMEGERMCSGLERIKIRPLLFAEDELADSDAFLRCDVVMVHVRPETMASPWLAPNFVPPPGMPLVLAGQREHLLALDWAVQARAGDFLIDGWQPEEALMRLRYALAAAAAPVASGPSPEEDGPAPPSISGDTPKVLIAEDDPMMQKLVQTVLQNHGMECCVASDGAQALRMLNEHPMHAAVLDVNMPGMNGFEVLTAIRDKSVPMRVILLTGRQQASDVERGFTLGADDYVIKPFNPSELVLRLKRLL